MDNRTEICGGSERRRLPDSLTRRLAICAGAGLASFLLSLAVWAPLTESQEIPAGETPVAPAEQAPPPKLICFGPGDGEPAALFRLTGERLRSMSMSVHLEDEYLYSVLAPSDAAEVDLRITNDHVRRVLGRELSDPDLPPVAITVVLYRQNQLTVNSLQFVTWNGYLQGSWLEFPRPTGVPLLDPEVDVSNALDGAVTMDVRLERERTVYYILAASTDRNDVLLHPESPEFFSRTRIVSGGSYSFSERRAEVEVVDERAEIVEVTDDEVDAPVEEPEIENLRLNFKTNVGKEYLVVWTLDRVGDAPGHAGDDADAQPTTQRMVWARSAVYELSTGQTRPAGEDSSDQ